jgi:hypothetical protein
MTTQEELNGFSFNFTLGSFVKFVNRFPFWFKSDNNNDNFHEDVRAFLQASPAYHAKYLWKRNVFLINVVEKSETTFYIQHTFVKSCGLGYKKYLRLVCLETREPLD